MEAAQTTIKTNRFKPLIPHLTTHKLWLGVTAFCAVLGGFMEVVYPFFLMQLTDAATMGERQKFITLTIWAALAMVFRAGMMYLHGQATTRYEAYTIRDLRDSITGHIQHLPVSYTETLHSGDLVSRLNNDVNKIWDLLKRLSEMIQQPITFVLAFAFMLTISWKLLLAACILIPVSGFVQNLVTKPIQQQSKKEMEELARANALTQDTIRGIYIVKAFNLESVLTKKFQNISDNIETAGIEISRRGALSTALFLALRYIPQLVCPLYGGYLAYQGEITVGGLLASMSLIWMVFMPIERFLDWLRVIREASPAVDRVFELLNHPTETITSQCVAAGDPAIAVSTQNVSFQYEENGAKILDVFSLQVQPNQTVGLVGPSGCGKSTVLKILCGFYQPQSGLVHLYGSDLFQSDMAEMRKMVSLVSQNTHLFPASIRENIAYGNAEATFDEIVAAAKAANAHDFIMQLPRGYDSEVGEWGAKLSGGEKQRIAIARAILKDAPILLLDEPTSALDTYSETAIQQALEKLMQGKAVIIVAHRLSTLRSVDKILVLNQGRIIEQGSHDELLQNDTLYQSLYMKQMAGYAMPTESLQEVTND
jgi:ABC-type multidrug transport system fused ATPase/permease subunit